MKTRIVNVSGGVDSTACYLLAIEQGEPFQAVFADTGNEHEYTLEYVQTLAAHTGGPEVEVVRADFSQKIEARKMKLEILRDNPQDGWTSERAEFVLKNLRVHGNPFLDLCVWKQRFPSTKARFCTVELKMNVIKRDIVMPAIVDAVAAGGRACDVEQWIGVRRDESRARADALERETTSNGSVIYRPIVTWTKKNCFDMLERHGLEPNPLYKLGFGRVGCMPCIHERKQGICEMAKRFPAHIDRIRRWETIVGDASKRGISTFFSANKTPGISDMRSHIDAVVEWSKTGRGGMQYDMFATQEPSACSSPYGLCE